MDSTNETVYVIPETTPVHAVPATPEEEILLRRIRKLERQLATLRQPARRSRRSRSGRSKTRRA